MYIHMLRKEDYNCIHFKMYLQLYISLSESCITFQNFQNLKCFKNIYFTSGNTKKLYQKTVEEGNLVLHSLLVCRKVLQWFIELHYNTTSIQGNAEHEKLYCSLSTFFDRKCVEQFLCYIIRKQFSIRKISAYVQLSCIMYPCTKSQMHTKRYYSNPSLYSLFCSKHKTQSKLIHYHKQLFLIVLGRF